MNIIEKHFIDRSRKYGNLPYCCTMSPDGEYIAYLKANGNAETLVLKAINGSCNVVLASNTFILSPCFVSDTLCWSEKCGADWILRYTRIAAAGEQVQELSLPGRPMSLSACSADEGKRGWLVWEQRNGKKTRLYMASVINGNISAVREVDTGRWNAYDPVCATDTNNQLHIAYCAFKNGNYRIMIQPVDLDGSIDVNKAMRVSNESGPCVYPSLSRRSQGGVWFSFTCLDVPGNLEFVYPYVQHLRRASQLACFRSRGLTRVGLFENGRVAAPLAPPSPQVRQGNIAAMRVFGSEGSARSHVFEDHQGVVRLLLRQHVDEDKSCVFPDNPPLTKPKVAPTPTGAHRYPDICIMTLEKKGWSESESIIPRAHFPSPIAFCLREDHLRICFTQDGRASGHRTSGEWFDNQGELAVGIIDVKLEPLDSFDYVCKDVVMTPIDGPSIEEPVIVRERTGKQITVWGQTHCHTIISVCNRELEHDAHFNYRFIQDVQHADFAAMTDHEYNTGPVEETFMKKLADYYYFRNQFVSLPGYEWTGSYCNHDGGPFGHLNVLWFGDDATAFKIHNPADLDDPGNTPERLWQCYKHDPVLTIPHHVVDALHWYNWSFWSEGCFTPVVEIFQDNRGSGESPRAPGVANFMHIDNAKWIVNALKEGKHFGFIAGADHFGLALAGVKVDKLTRQALFDALRRRECFATTGCTLEMTFEGNGQPMGSIVNSKEIEFTFKADSPELIQELHVLRNGEIYKTIAVQEKHCSYNWKTTRCNNKEFWYCRILLTNGEIAWSSPIWLEKENEV